MQNPRLALFWGIRLLNTFTRTEKKNGSVAIFVNSNFKCEKLDLDVFCFEQAFEVTGVEL